MNNQELIQKVHQAVYQQIQARGYAAPVDVLLDLGVLTKEKVEDWRFGRVPFLERVCNMNLHKLTFLMKEYHSFARKSGYEPSVTVYKKWGKGRKFTLRFSKSGEPAIEKSYSTHYVDKNRVKKAGKPSEKPGQLKPETMEK